MRALGPWPSWMLALRSFAICMACRSHLDFQLLWRILYGVQMDIADSPHLTLHCRASANQEANAAFAFVELNKTYLTDLLAMNNRARMFA